MMPRKSRTLKDRRRLLQFPAPHECSHEVFRRDVRLVKIDHCPRCGLPRSSAIKEICSESGEEKEVTKEEDEKLEFHSFKEFLEHHGDGEFWNEYLAKQEDRYKLLEVQIFLKSKGKVACAELVRSYNDFSSLYREDWEEFKAKLWDLRPTVGPYNNYQRLVSHDPIREPGDGFLDLYCSYDSDIAYLKFFEELKQKVEWKMSSSVAWDLAKDTLKNYENIDHLAIYYAVQDCRRWSYLDSMKDEMIAVYTTLVREVIEKRRRVKNVLKEILGNDMRPYPHYKNYIDDCLRIGNMSGFVCLLEKLKEYIAAKSEEDHVDEDMKDTVRKFFEEEQPHMLDMFTYADYVQRKMQLAKSLGIIPS